MIINMGEKKQNWLKSTLNFFFLAILGLEALVVCRLSLVAASRATLVRGLLIVVASLVAEPRL